ncbi:MAG TPA: hypothetical protein DCS42_04825 [Nitrospiraceae bacterium]|nr:hypothetical protein [Nitrospiraceae bacterium]
MDLQDIFKSVEAEHNHSLRKHGKWIDKPKNEQFEAIDEEIGEWKSAAKRHDIYGEHGEVAEAIQVMNVMARRIMYLTGEDQ